MKHFLVLSLVCAAAFAARAQSTAFNYQGRLAANGAPYTGFAEMQFALFNAPTGGVAVAASTPATASVNVSGGLFAVSLDFGAAAFPGADRFLEIQVRTNIGAFSALTPRQPLTPTPYALFARTAGTAEGPWVSSGSDLSYTAGRVGVGTATPAAGLHIKGAGGIGSTLALEGGNGAAMTFFPAGLSAGRKGFISILSPSSTDITIASESPGGRIALASPSSTVFATGGEENLRIVRGSIIDAALDYGSGFAVSHVGTGHYRITFNTSFASKPTVTATQDFAHSGGGAGEAMVAFIDAVTVSSADIYLFDATASELLDGGFHFIAIGPR